MAHARCLAAPSFTKVSPLTEKGRAALPESVTAGAATPPRAPAPPLPPLPALPLLPLPALLPAPEPAPAPLSLVASVLAIASLVTGVSGVSVTAVVLSLVLVVVTGLVASASSITARIVVLASVVVTAVLAASVVVLTTIARIVTSIAGIAARIVVLAGVVVPAILSTGIIVVAASIATNGEVDAVLLRATLGDRHENRLVVGSTGHGAGTVVTRGQTTVDGGAEASVAVAGIVDTLEEGKLLGVHGSGAVDVVSDVLDGHVGVANDLATLQLLGCGVVCALRVGEGAENHVIDLQLDIEGLLGCDVAHVLRVCDFGRNHVARGGDLTHGNTVARASRHLLAVRQSAFTLAEVDEVVGVGDRVALACGRLSSLVRPVLNGISCETVAARISAGVTAVVSALVSVVVFPIVIVVLSVVPLASVVLASRQASSSVDISVGNCAVGDGRLGNRGRSHQQRDSVLDQHLEGKSRVESERRAGII